MLPREYIYCTGLTLDGYYLDTGILPTSDSIVDALISGVTNGGYALGSRNTNSTTSAGQFNLYTAQSTTSYFGYGNARVNLTSNLMDILYGPIHIHTNKNEFEFVTSNAIIINATGTTNTFTGTRPIYIGGLNNAGNFVEGRCTLHGFKWYSSDGVLLHNLIPCKNTQTGYFGVYDEVDNVFIPASSSTVGARCFLVQVQSDVGGEAYIKTFDNGKVSMAYGRNDGYSVGYNKIKLVAKADKGYSFVNWTVNNTYISNKTEFEYSATSNVTIKANFVKNTSDEFNVGYRTMGITYGSSYIDGTYRDDVYANVVNAQIENSTIEQTTTTINLEVMPSAYTPNMPIFIFNPKGKIVYSGIINSVDGNTLVVREPLSIYDQDFLFTNNSSYNRQSTLAYMYDLFSASYYRTSLNIPFSDLVIRRKYSNIYVARNYEVPLNEKNVFNVVVPSITETKVDNLEEYVQSLFNQLGVYTEVELITGNEIETLNVSRNKHYMKIMPTYINEDNAIVISDNVETITNVEINMEDVETTWLVIYNSNGTTTRAVYGMTNEGNYVEYTGGASIENYIAYSNCKIKVVNSDESIKTLVYQHLSNSQYNHKITFTINLDGSLIGFDSIKLGQLVKFYYQNKLYNSVVTGIKFEIKDNLDEINKLEVTLGNVRTSLTSKLNLGKKK